MRRESKEGRREREEGGGRRREGGGRRSGKEKRAREDGHPSNLTVHREREVKRE